MMASATTLPSGGSTATMARTHGVAGLSRVGGLADQPADEVTHRVPAGGADVQREQVTQQAPAQPRGGAGRAEPAGQVRQGVDADEDDDQAAGGHRPPAGTAAESRVDGAAEGRG